MQVQCKYIYIKKEVTKIAKKEKNLTIRISDVMLDNFDKALKKTEQSRSEILRDCIRKFIDKNK